MLNEGSQVIWQDTSLINKLFREKGRKTAILIHVNPDGDAVGSALGLAKVLISMGHECKVISPNAIPGFLQWMPGYENIIIYEEQPEKASLWANSAEIIVTLDFNNLSRVKQFEKFVFPPDAYILMIDHHPGPENFAHCIISDTSSSSTAELLYRFLKKEGFSAYIDKDVASCIFAGIMTDTGCFSYNSSGSNTYITISELLEHGIEKDTIYALVYDNFSAGRMRMLGYTLYSKMEVFPGLHTALIWLTKDEMGRFNFKTGDTEGFVNYPLSIGSIRFSAFFVEKDDHIKVSFRSKGRFEVNEFAKSYFNGGGHVNAAGGETYESMEAAIERFRKALALNSDKLSSYEDQ